MERNGSISVKNVDNISLDYIISKVISWHTVRRSLLYVRTADINSEDYMIWNVHPLSSPLLILGHHKLHTGERPYTCPGCSRSFARMDALNRLDPHNIHVLIADIVNQEVNVLYIICLHRMLDLNKMQLKDGCPSLLDSEDLHLLKVPRHHCRNHPIIHPISTSIPL